LKYKTKSSKIKKHPALKISPGLARPLALEEDAVGEARKYGVGPLRQVGKTALIRSPIGR
jgi:hypothetical protein